MAVRSREKGEGEGKGKERRRSAKRGLEVEKAHRVSPVNKAGGDGGNNCFGVLLSTLCRRTCFTLLHDGMTVTSLSLFSF